MKRIVIFVLCVALVFGAVALPTFLGGAFSGLTTVAEYATELLLPETINPENIPVTKDIAEKINEALGFTVIDVSGVPDGGVVDGCVISSRLYQNVVDGYNYIIIRWINVLSATPLFGDVFTYKDAIPATYPSLGLVYGLNTFTGVQFRTLGGNFKIFRLQETNINTINWIEENW